MIDFSSPCVSICQLDEAGDCLGCLRTEQEIFSWMTFTQEERNAIMADIENNRGQKDDNE
jgi:predicted Fe-S protein YdhL (DUF1289 family)